MFTEAFPILTTRDLSRLSDFYQRVLGFTQTYRFPTEGKPQFVSLELGGSYQLGIGESEDTPTSPEQRFDLCVYADDCDAAVAQLRAHGAKVTSEPTDMPWGERAAHAEDPDGNRLVILHTRYLHPAGIESGTPRSAGSDRPQSTCHSAGACPPPTERPLCGAHRQPLRVAATPASMRRGNAHAQQRPCAVPGALVPAGGTDGTTAPGRSPKAPRVRPPNHARLFE
jgi:lactoylglutathione lyase